MSLTISPTQSQVIASGAASSGLPVPATQKGAVPTSSMQLAVMQEEARAVDDGELLARLIRYFEESEAATYEARIASERDYDYYCGHQLTAVELAALKDRRQPPIVNNYIRRKCDFYLGSERKGRSDPKAFPRTPQHEDMSDVATQALRFVSDEQRYDNVRSAVYQDMIIQGFGGAEVSVEPRIDREGYDIKIRHVPWDRLWYDPHSSRTDFSDCNFSGEILWMDRADALDLYPGCENVLEAAFASIGSSQTYEDKPLGIGWCDNRRTRVRVVRCHYKQAGEFWSATYTRGGFLEGPAKSPYVDRHGKARCPLIMQSAYVDRQNRRFGVVRDMISLQEALNKRESKLLHLLNVQRIVMEDGAVDDVDLARREVARPDGLVVKNRGFEFEISRDQSEVSGHFQLLQYTVSQFNAMGANSSLAGKDPRELSGRAILANQSGGMVEIEPLTDALRNLNHHVFEHVWEAIRRFWTGPEFIRVTDDAKSSKFVGLNLPVTLADELAQMPPDQAQQLSQQLQLQPNDQRLQTVVRIQNDLDSCDIEISIEEGPDTPTLQIEQWQAFTQLPQQILQQFPPEFFIQANPAIRDKDRLTKILEAHQQQQAAGQAQQAAAAADMQKAQVAKAQADAQDKSAQAADRQAQTVERLHGIAKDHATAMHTPIVPGVGPVQPGDNPLLQQPPQPHPLVQQAQLAGMAADTRATDAQTMQRLHGIAMDHAQAVNTPVGPSVGPAGADQASGGPQPAQNALMPPSGP